MRDEAERGDRIAGEPEEDENAATMDSAEEES